MIKSYLKYLNEQDLGHSYSHSHASSEKYFKNAKHSIKNNVTTTKDDIFWYTGDSNLVYDQLKST